MQPGMIGLGRMEANIVGRLTKGRHQCVVFDRLSEAVKQLAGVEPDDVLIDGGDAYYGDDLRPTRGLALKKIHYVDVSTGGGHQENAQSVSVTETGVRQ